MFTVPTFSSAEAPIAAARAKAIIIFFIDVILFF